MANKKVTRSQVVIRVYAGRLLEKLESSAKDLKKEIANNDYQRMADSIAAWEIGFGPELSKALKEYGIE